VVVVFDSVETQLEEHEEIEQVDGKLSTAGNDSLMNSVMENDQETIEQGKMVNEAFNQGMQGFTPDMMFQQLVKNYQLAKQLYGEKLLRLVSGYDPDYIQKNLNIPEFQKELKMAISRQVDKLKESEFVDRDGIITDKGVDLASMLLYVEELDHLVPQGIFGEKVSKKKAHYGERAESRLFKKGDRYKDINVRKTMRLAMRRGRKEIGKSELKISERQSKGQVYLLYGIDASASMKGNKIETGKKAGIALAYQAIQKKDLVGLIVFGKEVEEAIAPTDNFSELLRSITTIKASKETDFTKLVNKSIELFPPAEATKHLLIITDALPTVGEEPEKETLDAVSRARAAGITLSIIGIDLDDKGEELGKQMAERGDGRLYMVHSLDEVDKLVLQDYNAVRA
jgi:Mg-chelatase subunit ChlD